MQQPNKTRSNEHMKKAIASLVAVGLLGGSQAWGIPVNVTRLAGYATGDGGEFNISPVFSGGNYAPVALVNGGFETFCIQATGPGSTIDVPGHYNATLAPTPVSLGTAWLYNQFATGHLTGYDYADTGLPGSTVVNTLLGARTTTGRAASAYGLQNAIWLMEGFSGPSVDVTAATPWVNFAESSTGHTLAELEGQNNGEYQVARVVLTDDNGEPVQNMIGLVPDGGSSILLLGMGLSGVAFVSRKLRA